ncbi:abc transporter [Moniliophthora roreri MCA 2997]|uniref:Abc transporter n=1 Tax=Moniliophthora roreri (strain MCA 2997) TaxID=1381753 RepID=V2YU69_MONRO|nr:abc transporter [Moniliophthora roreri MCA 2997]
MCTIHQPRHDIFTNILVLSKGYTLFSGPTVEVTSWFEKLLPGSLSEHLNPADYLIIVAAVGNHTPEAKAAAGARLTRARWRMLPIADIDPDSILTTWRYPMGLIARWLEAILMSVICELAFLNLGRDLSGIRFSTIIAIYCVCFTGIPDPYLRDVARYGSRHRCLR